MKQYIVLAVTMFFSAVAHAEICYKLEYVELDSLPREELLQIHCQYRDDMMKLAGTGDRTNMNLATKCADEVTRTERIVARKYGIKSTNEARVKEVNALCPRK